MFGCGPCVKSWQLRDLSENAMEKADLLWPDNSLTGFLMVWSSQIQHAPQIGSGRGSRGCFHSFPTGYGNFFGSILNLGGMVINDNHQKPSHLVQVTDSWATFIPKFDLPVVPWMSKGSYKSLIVLELLQTICKYVKYHEDVVCIFVFTTWGNSQFSSGGLAWGWAFSMRIWRLS